MKMTKIVLSAFAFIFALGGAIAANVSVAAGPTYTIVATLVNGFTCTITGVCTTTIFTTQCTVGAGIPAYTISSSCIIQARGRFERF